MSSARVAFLGQQTQLRRSSERISSYYKKNDYDVSRSVNLCFPGKATIQLKPFGTRPQSEVPKEVLLSGLHH